MANIPPPDDVDVVADAIPDDDDDEDEPVPVVDVDESDEDVDALLLADDEAAADVDEDEDDDDALASDPATHTPSSQWKSRPQSALALQLETHSSPRRTCPAWQRTQPQLDQPPTATITTAATARRAGALQPFESQVVNTRPLRLSALPLSSNEATVVGAVPTR
jgi:hypothetical protein